MSTQSLERLDTDIQHLTLSEQVWLMERLAHYIREQTLHSQLAEMAADPEIQREIGLIQAEFAVTEEDGLPDEA